MDASAKQIQRRLDRLEKDSHAPFDFTRLVRRLEELEDQVKILKRSLPPKKRVRSRS